MKNMKAMISVAALMVAIGVVFALKPKSAPPAPQPAARAASQPRLVELGADKCVPCKMMAPILAELKQTYAGQLQVDFIDVWKNPEAGKEYGIRVIPTQIFYGPDGREFFRHEGFFARDDILAKWKEAGVVLHAAPTTAEP